MSHRRYPYYRWIAVFAGLCAACFCVRTASAATIYVNSATGNDTTGSGTSGSPFKTFTKGYASTTSGDTLDLAGTFTWTDAAETGDSATTGFSIAKNLTIRGQGMNSTVIQASSTAKTADRSVFYNGGYVVTFQDLTIRYGVRTSGNGGGAITNYGTITLLRARVTENYYNSASSYGSAGVYCDQNTTAYVSSSTFDNNDFNGQYYGSGGLYTSQSASVYINNSTFANNHATSSDPTTFPFSYSSPSGAFGTFRFGEIRITNSTFTGNTTNAYGGAIQTYYKDSVTMTNTTVANNRADLGVGGYLYQSESNGYNLYIKNSILANNSVTGTFNDFYAYDAASAGRITDNGYNIIEYSTNRVFSATGDLTGDQVNVNLSATPANNDTLLGTQTLALSAGSVAIDAGDPANAANNGVAIPRRDQRNAGRNGTADIGAYEYNGSGVVAQYTFTYVAGTGGTLSGSASQTVNQGTDGSAVTAVPSTGYAFVDWSDGSTANPRTDTNAQANVSVTANFALNTYTLTYAAGTGGTVTGSTTQTAAHGSSGSAVTAVADAGYAFSAWSDASTANPRTDASVTGNLSVTAQFADAAAPAISSVAVTPSVTTASVAWTTGESASSKVEYGPTASYGTATAESDLSPRVATHTVSLSSLTACALYHYRVTSIDGAGNAATSTDGSFTTTGCTGSSSVAASISATVEVSATGTVALGSNVELVIPADFATTTASFQINQLDGTAVIAAAGRPEGYVEVEDHAYAFHALTASSTAITLFQSSITVTMIYADADISSIVERTLRIFRWADAQWTALSSCVVNEAANSVTCETDHFSTFSLFGQPVEAASSASTGGGRLLASPGSGPGASDMSVGMGETKDIGIVTEGGVNALAYIGSIMRFHLPSCPCNEPFSVKIDGLDLARNIATLNLPSGLTVQISLGTSVDADADGDGIADLRIIFSSLRINRVELTLIRLSRGSAAAMTPIRLSPEQSDILSGWLGRLDFSRAFVLGVGMMLL